MTCSLSFCKVSLVDYFAAHALQGLMANGITIDIKEDVVGIARARVAYVMADAMMAAKAERASSNKKEATK